ncbi:MAG: AsmA family protein [Elusimicrobia bacterium]|nr:AsmA family protein [Elusimicrobiota bacterium]
METKRKKIIIISALATTLIISGFYFGTPLASKKLLKNLSESYSKKLGRKIDFGKISFSFIDGLVIADINIFEKNNPSKSAYSMKTTALNFETLPLLKRNFIFSKIKFKNAKFTLIRNKNGVWDFSDIQAILPIPKDKFYATWPKQIIAENSELLIIDNMSDNKWSLDKADLKFSKRMSYYGGSFSISAEGILKGSLLKNSFISQKINSIIKADFEQNNLNSVLGEIELKDSAFNDAHIRDINLKWNFLGVNSKEDKQDYKAELEIEEILVANIDNSFRKNIIEAFNTFSKIYGKKIPEIHELTFKDISARISFSDDIFLIKNFVLDSNVFNIHANFKLDNTDKIDLNFKGKVLGKTMGIIAQGHYNNPHIKPEFSFTIRTKLVSLIKSLTKSIKLELNKIDKNKLDKN